MDDALKARLIGASILVVLAVALLPELLSGPKAPPDNAAGGKGTKVITIDLGGAVDASRAPRPDVAPGPAATPAMPTVSTPAANAAALDDTSEPEPGPIDGATIVASPPGTTAPAPATAAPKPTTVAEPAPKPEVAPATAPKPGAGSGKYAVQVGAFSSADGARKLAGELKGAGFPAYVLSPAPGKKLHRVRVGPVADRAAADQLAARLKSRGLPVNVTSDG